VEVAAVEMVQMHQLLLKLELQIAGAVVVVVEIMNTLMEAQAVAVL
jgi:hypothetical protein